MGLMQYLYNVKLDTCVFQASEENKMVKNRSIYEDF